MTEVEAIPCDHVIARLWEYIDGELSDDQARRIRAHLEVCGHCYPQWDFQRAFVEFLGVHSETPIPSALRHRVFDVLLHEDESPGADDDPASSAG